jgi:tetratricopeptide (TPR) repeat protein
VRSRKKILSIILITVFLISPGVWAKEEDAFGKGLELIGQQRYDEAIKAFSTAIEIIPRDYQAYNYRGVAWALKGNYDRAIADYDKAIEIRPRYAEAYNNRGFARTRRGDLGNALKDYSRALEINPFFGEAYNNKAWVLATCADQRFRNGGQAVRLAQKAVELKPDVGSLDTLAAAYAAAGNFDAAVTTQEKAIQNLLLADRSSEVPEYLPHLNKYKSKQSLLINYAAWSKTAGTREEKISLKKQTPKKPSLPAPSQKVAAASEPEMKKSAAALQKKEMAAPVIKPSPTAKAQKAAPVSTTPKPAAAPKTKRKLAPPVKPLPYTIQVSAYRNPQTSNQVARKLIASGDPAFTSPVDISGKGRWYRVYVGNYTTLEEAKIAAAGLKKRKFHYVNISKKPYTVQVGLSASESEAQKLKSTLETKGYLAYSLPVADDADRVRVLIGAFESKEAAADLTRKLKKDGFNPEIGLR